MTDAAHSVPVDTLLAHRSWVRALAWSLVRDAHLVDEVEQETWLRALRSPPREEAAARGWLATVVRNVVRNRFRSQSRRTAHEEATPPSAAAPATVDVVGRAESQQAVVRAVMTLDEPYRTTLLLRFFDGLPPRDIAARMEVPVETVRTRTKRALSRVRDELSSGTDGRAGAFALLAPLLAEGPPQPLTAAAGASAASVMATTTGALVMSAAAQKIALAAVVVLASLAVGWVVVESADDGAGDTSSVATAPTEDTASAPVPAATEDVARRRVQVTDDRDAPSSVTPADAPAETWSTVRVVLPDGTEGVRARAVVLDDGAVVGEPVADDAGRLRIAGRGTRTLVIAVPGCPPHVAEVDLGPDETEVRLPAGRVVEGVVRVAGVAPREPIELRLRVDGAALPAEIAAALRSSGLDAGRTVTRTGPEGRFRFSGLPEVAEGRLVLEQRGHAFATEGGPFLDVPVPARGLVLDLVARPRVTGRVVDEGGAPVARAQVRVRWRSAEGNGAFTRSVDAEGRFDVPLPGPAFEELFVSACRGGSVTTNAAGGDGGGVVEVRVPVEPLPGGDVGDVVLPSLRSVRLRVVDPAGRPIPDATVLADGRSSGCGADGIAEVEVSGPRPRVAVGRLGYASVERELAPGVAQPVEIVLQPAARLTLQVMPPDHGIADLRVRLTARGTGIFRSPADWVTPVDARAGASGSGSGGVSALADGTLETVVWLDPDRNGNVILNALAPDVPFEVALVDGMGTVHDRGALRLNGVEQRLAVLRVRESAHGIGGRVVDAAGNPVARARVLVTASGATGRDAEAANGPARAVFTTATGRFRLDGVFAETVDVLVTSGARVDGDAFVPWSRAGIDAAAGADLDVRLTRGTTVRLTLRDADGAPVEDAWGYADIALPYDGSAFLWPLDAVEPDAAALDETRGVYTLAGLPRDGGAVTVRIEIEKGGATYGHEVSIDPAAGDIAITLGEPALRESDETE